MGHTTAIFHFYTSNTIFFIAESELYTRIVKTYLVEENTAVICSLDKNIKLEHSHTRDNSKVQCQRAVSPRPSPAATGPHNDNRVKIIVREIRFRGDANPGISELTTPSIVPLTGSSHCDIMSGRHTHTQTGIVNATGQKRFYRLSDRFSITITINICTIYTQR